MGVFGAAQEPQIASDGYGLDPGTDHIDALFLGERGCWVDINGYGLDVYWGSRIHRRWGRLRTSLSGPRVCAGEGRDWPHEIAKKAGCNDIGNRYLRQSSTWNGFTEDDIDTATAYEDPGAQGR